MARPGGQADPAYLVETINQNSVDTTDFVPTGLRLFLDHPRAATCTSLKVINSCGETLTRDLQDQFFDQRKSVGYDFEIEAVNQDLRNEKIQSDIVPLSTSLKLQEHMPMVKSKC